MTLKVTDKALIDVPSGTGYAFLGTAADKVHILPQYQQSGIVWPGWNTRHESIVDGTRGNVTWRLQQVDGPGEFKLFLTGSFGTPEVIFDSAKSLPQQIGIAPNTHAHGNWAFTKPGRYRLTVGMTATTTAGKSVSDTRILALAVGDSTSNGLPDTRSVSYNAHTHANWGFTAAGTYTLDFEVTGKLISTGVKAFTFTVDAIVPDNADAHAYEPTLRDVRNIVYADVAFSNYLLLEAQNVIKTLDANLPEGVRQISLAEGATKYAAEIIPLVEDVSLDTVWLGLRARGSGPPTASTGPPTCGCPRREQTAPAGCRPI